MTLFNTYRLEKILLSVWLAANLAIGVLTVHKYGISIDEPNNYRYAADTLDAYPSFFGTLYQPKYDSTFDGHGPAFVTLVDILVRGIQDILPNVFPPDLWHFSYFITFQLTGLCLYWLVKRWFNIWTAWGLLILFSTQPLLLGHAFVNPKDIPFMFLLTLSVVLGFRLVDRVEAGESSVSLERHIKVLSSKFQEIEPRRRKKFLTVLALALAAGSALLVFSSQVSFLAKQVVTFFYTTSSDSWAGRIFGSIATHASSISTEDYTVKVLRLLHRVEVAALLAGLLFFPAYFGFLISNPTFSTLLRKLGEAGAHLVQSLRNSLKWSQLKIGWSEIFRALGNPHVLLAGIALGLATGVRAIAPLAGVIVVLYLLVKVRSRAWSMAIAYFLIAGIVTYLAWPHLWGAPIQRYLAGLGIITNFPGYPQRVLFNGQLYKDTDLPRSYLPVLLNIQFTEPYLLGFYVGLGVLTWRLLRGRIRTDLLLYVGLGFAFPLFGLILLHPPLYNNFRQELFLVPAMFVPAAFALELLFSKMRQNWTRVLLMIAIALPGVYSSVKLYPYQYIYYNSLVGGTAGAYNRYDLDYLRISLREVAVDLDKAAPRGAIIVVTRSAGLFAKYARPDLIVDKPINSILNLANGYDYIVQITRRDARDSYPDAKTVVVIERAGVVLATAKDVHKVSRKQDGITTIN